MAETIKLTVSRYRPEEESEPTFQTYDVPYNKDWVILDALNYVKDQLDGSLTFRWSCRMGVCGSCGMMVNGEPKLTCKTALSDYGDTVTIEPLANFPIVRDLVVTMLQTVDFDKWANRGGVEGVTGNSAISKTIGTIIYVLIAIPVAIAALEQLGIDLSRRAETLSVEDFAELGRICASPA